MAVLKLKNDCFKVVMCVVVFLCLFITVVTSSSEIPFDAEEIDAVIKKTFECKNNPGLAVSVVRNGKVT